MSGPRTSSYTKRKVQGPPGVSATVVGQDTTPRNSEIEGCVSVCRSPKDDMAKYHGGVVCNREISLRTRTMLFHSWGRFNCSVNDIDILKWILFFSGFDFCDKYFPCSFALLSLSTAAHQFHTSVIKIKVMLLATPFHDRYSLICSIDDTTFVNGSRTLVASTLVIKASPLAPSLSPY